MYRRLVSLFIAIVMIVQLSVSGIGGHVNAAKKIKLNKSSVTLVVGKTQKLKVNGTKKKIKWKSSKKKIATVSKKGVVKAKKAGKTVITATVGKRILKCKVKVIKKNNKKKVTTEEVTTRAAAQEAKVEYKENVIVDEVENQTDYSIVSVPGNDSSSNAVGISIDKNEVTSKLKAGDIVVLPGNDKNNNFKLPIKVQNISDNGDNYKISAVAPEFEEVISDVDVDYVIIPDDSCIKYNDEIVKNVENVKTGATVNKSVELWKNKLDISLADEKGSSEFSGSLTINPPVLDVQTIISCNPTHKVEKANVSLSVKVDVDGAYAYSRDIKDNNITSNAKGFIDNILADVSIPIPDTVLAVECELHLVVNAEGEAKIVAHMNPGVQFLYDGVNTPKVNPIGLSPQLGDETNLNGGISFTVQPQLYLRLNTGGFDKTKEWDMFREFLNELREKTTVIKLEANLGVGVLGKYYITRPQQCLSIGVYPIVDFELDLEYGAVGKILKKLFPHIDCSWELLGKDNLKEVLHLEHLKKVPKCTYEKLSDSEMLKEFIKQQKNKGATVNEDIYGSSQYTWMQLKTDKDGHKKSYYIFNDRSKEGWQNKYDDDELVLSGIDWNDCNLNGEIEVPEFEWLVTLDFSHNKVQKVDVTYCNLLQNLCVQDNLISNIIDVTKNLKIQKIYCYHNNVPYVKVSSETKQILIDVYCDNNTDIYSEDGNSISVVQRGAPPKGMWGYKYNNQQNDYITYWISTGWNGVD